MRSGEEVLTSPPATAVRLKTGEVVAGRVRARIARGDLAPGDRLPPEDELMEAFGVARTTLREGLRILEAQGLIEVRRGRHGGARVIAPRIDRLAAAIALHLQLQRTTIGDLDEARQLIEPRLAARLARTRTSQGLAALRAAIGEAHDAAERNDRHAFAIAATHVHRTVMEQAGNATLATVSRLLQELVRDYYEHAAAKSTQAVMRRAVRSYGRLLTLVEAGDADAAEDHWRRQMAFTIGRAARHTPLALFPEPTEV